MTPTPLVGRSQDEIVAQIEAWKHDIFGFRSEVLVNGLDFEHAKAYLKDGVSEDEWNAITAKEPSVYEQMRSYMEFAIGKAQDHRGISAYRSTEKLNAWTWLLGCEPIEEPFAQYGAPILRALCIRHGFTWPDDEDINRMAEGKPCHDGCLDGCGS
jgi:hypothetical protein